MTDWKRFFPEIDFAHGARLLLPKEAAMKRADEETGLVLPESYKSYCRSFGLGEFDSGHYDEVTKCRAIAVPGFSKASETS